MKTAFLAFLAAGFLIPRAGFAAGASRGEFSGESGKWSWVSRNNPPKIDEQLKFLGIVFSDELPLSERERAIKELEKTAGNLIPEAKEALFLAVRRKKSPFSIKLSALEVLRKARLSEEKAQMEAVRAAQSKLPDKDSEEERRLTALLYDIISALLNPSLAVQEELASLAAAENPISKSTPKAALQALSRVSYSQSAAEILAMGLISGAPGRIKPMIAESLSAADFDFEAFFLKEGLPGEWRTVKASLPESPAGKEPYHHSSTYDTPLPQIESENCLLCEKKRQEEMFAWGITSTLFTMIGGLMLSGGGGAPDAEAVGGAIVIAGALGIGVLPGFACWAAFNGLRSLINGGKHIHKQGKAAPDPAL